MVETTAGYVLFRLGAEMYGLPVEQVQGIIRYEHGTPVPKAPEGVIGVINLRGRIVPVVDLSVRLGRGTFEPEEGSRIVVAEGEAGAIGLAVDAASEVAWIAEDSIRPAPEAAVTAESAEAIAGVAERDGGLVVLLDLDRAVPRTTYAPAIDTTTPEEA